MKELHKAKQEALKPMKELMKVKRQAMSKIRVGGGSYNIGWGDG